MGSSTPTEPDVITKSPLASSRLSAIMLPDEKYRLVLFKMSCKEIFKSIKKKVQESQQDCDKNGMDGF